MTEREVGVEEGEGGYSPRKNCFLGGHMSWWGFHAEGKRRELKEGEEIENGLPLDGIATSYEQFCRR